VVVVKRKFCLSLFVPAALAGAVHESRGQSVLRPREFRSPDRAYELTSLVWKLRQAKTVSARSAGYGTGGEFFKLSEEVLLVGTGRDFRRMIEDENVIVKAMGLVCLARSGGEHGRELLRLHTSDARPVMVVKDCIVYDTTVGEIARRLLAEPNFLGHEKREAARTGAARD